MAAAAECYFSGTVERIVISRLYFERCVIEPGPLIEREPELLAGARQGRDLLTNRMTVPSGGRGWKWICKRPHRKCGGRHIGPRREFWRRCQNARDHGVARTPLNAIPMRTSVRLRT